MSQESKSSISPQGTAVDFDPFALDTITASVPSTEAQKEMWSSVQLGDDANCAFNESISLKLQGSLSIDNFKIALAKLYGLHDSLRSVFGPDGATMIITAPSDKTHCTYLDISSESSESRIDRIKEFLDDAVNTPFDLIAGPLTAPLLIKIADTEHLFVLTAHHSICDGFSTAILLPELGQLYTAECKGVAAPITSPFQFASYARNEIAFHQSAEYKTTLAFWKKQFDDIPSPLDLPLDYKRPASRTFESLREDILIPADLIRKVKQVGTAQGASFFVTMLASFSGLLHHITNQDDIVIGIPAAGQNAVGQKDLVGHCVNLLPLRTKPQSMLSFKELLKSVKSTMLDAFENQQFTFGTLLQSLQIKRDNSRIPLVSVLFNVDQTIDNAKLGFESLVPEFISNPRHFENFELFINAMETHGDLRIECQYNTNLFSQETITRWFAQFTLFLEQIVEDPSKTLGTISLLTQGEKDLYTSINATNVSVPTVCLHELIHAQALKSPMRIAVSALNGSLTYQELDEKSNQLAHSLIKKGVLPGTLIGLCVERTTDLLVGILGILKSGAAYVPIDPLYPQERIGYMIEDAELTLILAHKSTQAVCEQSGISKILLDDSDAISHSEPKTLPTISMSPESPAYVIFTSGSTGRPKGVIVPHRSVVNFLFSMQQKPGIAENDSILAITTLSFDIAVLEIFLPLTCGAKTILVDKQTAGDGNLLLDTLIKSKATIMQATPTTWRFLIAAGWQKSPSLVALCGGEPFPPDLAIELCTRAAKVFNMYGPTETTVWSTCCIITNPSAPIHIGLPIANTTISIVNEQGHKVPLGVAGELCIGGLGVTLGYLKKPDITAEAFISDSTNPGTIIYKTGDLARILPNGTIEHLGRIDGQVKIRGYRIEPGEIEAVLARFSGIAHAAVVKVEPHPNDVRLVAYIVYTQEPAEQAALRTFLKARLPEYMIPQHFIGIGHIPLTPAGKIDRKKLAGLFSLDIQIGKGGDPPKTPTEEAVALIWREVLGLGTLGRTDNFFDLGGHSLLVTQVISRLRKIMGFELSMRQFFEMPTIELCATHFEAVQKIRNSSTKQATSNESLEEVEI